MSGGNRPSQAERMFALGLAKPIDLNGDEPCIGHVAIFFPDRDGRTNAEKQATRQAIATAKRLCAGCPRAFECRSKARARDERDGIWGGEDFYQAYGQPRRRKAIG